MRAPPRLSFAFASALCAHAAVTGALVLWQRSSPKPIDDARPKSPPTDLFILSDEGTSSPQSPLAIAAPPERRAVQGVTPAKSRAIHEESAAEATPERETASDASVVSTHAIANPAAPIDLGLGSLWKSVAVAEAQRSQNDFAGSNIDRAFREAAEARDHDLGLGPSGPLVSAAHEAGSSPRAPDTGSAIFDVEADAAGKVTRANVVSSTRDGAEWSAVAQELVTLMASKTLRMPTGARGLRVRLRISAERTSPSGTHGKAYAGAVPDDVPGSDPVCVGVGLARKCLKGMPVGVTVTAADMANLGGTISRIVHAEILGERAL